VEYCTRVQYGPKASENNPGPHKCLGRREGPLSDRSAIRLRTYYGLSAGRFRVGPGRFLN
jgi:hypothetical protein